MSQAVCREIEAKTRDELRGRDINEILDEPLNDSALEEEFKDVEADDGVDLSNVGGLALEGQKQGAA